MGTIFKLYGLRTHIESWGGTPITRFSWYQQKYLWKIKKNISGQKSFPSTFKAGRI